METTMIELSDEARTLIRRVGSADGPSRVDRARVKRRIVATLAGAGAALGSGGTIAAGAPAGALATAAVSKLTVGSVAMWLALGAGLGAAVSAPALVSAYRETAPAAHPAPVRPAVAVTSARPTQEARPMGESPHSDAPEMAPATGASEPASGRPKPSGRMIPETSQAETPHGASSLAEETRLLEAAQRELARKNTSAALVLLDEHATRFPAGALSEERAAARVLALCDLGRSAEAKRAAEVFVRASPRSPLVPRLQGSCARSEHGVDVIR
jgi:hypothetical protein